jgi:predicted nucleotidyltransferase
MRLTDADQHTIQRIVVEELGPGASVRLFGSRLNDAARGGDIDLLVELTEPVEHPARLSARLSVLIMRAMEGRKTDILLSAPNLSEFPIHRLARQQGIRL